MIAVIFEVWPESGKADDYLAIAADLRPLLDTIDGFLSIERFTSSPIHPNTSRSPSGGMRRRSPSGARNGSIASPAQGTG